MLLPAGKLDPDIGARAVVRGDASPAAVGGGDRLDDREAEAGATAAARCVATAESLERPLAELRIESDSLVAD